jgi:serine/threonine protein kinase
MDMVVGASSSEPELMRDRCDAGLFSTRVFTSEEGSGLGHTSRSSFFSKAAVASEDDVGCGSGCCCCCGVCGEFASMMGDNPTPPSEVSELLPRASHEQSRTIARQAANRAAREVRDFGAEEASKLTTQSRLFRRFGLDPDQCSRTWKRFMDLVSALLHFDPNQRITARGGVKHAYVAHLLRNDPQRDLLEKSSDTEYANAVKETVRGGSDYWAFENKPIEEAWLRAAFWEEMQIHEVDQAPSTAPPAPKHGGLQANSMKSPPTSVPTPKPHFSKSPLETDEEMHASKEDMQG